MFKGCVYCELQQTLSKATVELLPNQSIVDGFQLLVGLAEIHVPRMWVEKKTGDQDHQVIALNNLKWIEFHQILYMHSY